MVGKMLGIIGGAGVAATNKLNVLIEERFTKNGAYRDARHYTQYRTIEEETEILNKCGFHDISMVQSFTRERNTGLEWAGMSVMPLKVYHERQNCFVYQIIEKNSPVFAQNINLVEVDTPNDLQRASLPVLI